MTAILRQWTTEGLLCKLWREEAGTWRGCVFVDARPVACAELESDASEDSAAEAVSALAGLESRRRSPPLDWARQPVTDLALKLEPPHRIPEYTLIREPFQLADDLWIMPKDWDTYRAVAAACDAPGENRGRVADLRAPAYGIARTSAPEPDKSHWDPDQRLALCIATSRLVRPTSLGYQFAVRIRGTIGDGACQIIPGPVRGFGTQAWVADANEDYLRQEDLPAIRELVQAFFASPFAPKSRLRQAFWFHEYAALTQLLDIRWLLTATALESLLCLDPAQSTRHFTRRLPLLAMAVGCPPLSAADASRMWGMRCAISHGSKHGGLDAEDHRVYSLCEAVLQATLRKAILDHKFRDVFVDADSLEAAFPVPPRAPQTHKCSHCGQESTI